MGTALEGPKAGKTYSLELCGGTHARATGDIGVIRVVSEGAVAAGVRRLEALTGDVARRYLDEQDRRLKDAAALLKVSPSDVLPRLEALVDERRKLERELSETRRKLALGGGGGGSDAASDVRDVAGTRFLGKVVSGVAPRDLKSLADDGKKSLGSGVVAFVGVGEDGKASVVVGVTEDLTKKFSAVDLVRKASAALGGQGGGGRPDMAQAGGPDAAKADAALQAVEAAMAG
jgi:alanyl-tRNA synthetase